MLEANPLAGAKRGWEPTVPTGDAFDRGDFIEALTGIGVAAALALLRAAGDRSPHIKADGSPVTAADRAADAVIWDGVAALAPELPVISEERNEGKPVSGLGRRYILVDPLDGTRDFIAGRDEYTVNIALMADGAPVLGVIVAPAVGLIWRGRVGRGAERLTFAADGKISGPRPIHTRKPPAEGPAIMVSRSHFDAATKTYLDRLPNTQLVPCGSSVKFCRIAEGAADHYPRLAPTHDWDIAAGHAILSAAGGSVATPEGQSLVYGTKELLIPGFLAWGDTRDHRSD
jgi:3'(2'), 5'-bisphosphate nucleotidase